MDAPAGAPEPAPPQFIEKATEAVKNSSGSILVVLIGVALLAFLVAYVLYWLINRYVVNKKSFLLPATRYPVVGTQYTKVSGADIPSTGNGKRMSMCFWIYLHDIDKYKGTFRHVFHRGDQKIRNSSPSPLVFLDQDTNRLHITFYPGTNDGSVVDNPAQDYNTFAMSLLQKYGITVDYIPLQRWVHLAVVVNENANGGSMTAYVDGELVNTVTSNKDGKIISNMMLDKAGDVWVGGSSSEEVGPGFSGLVSKITFFNTDINAKDVYDDYQRGPVDSLMSKLGLPAYGVRSPVYRIG